MGADAATQDAKSREKRQAARHSLPERQEVDQLRRDLAEHLADAVDPEPVHEPHGRGEDGARHQSTR
jgi:hypothetical protein